MKAHITRFDAHYEVAFSRPAFSRIASFSQIIEPIHDAFSSEIQIPSDAIKLETGSTIAATSVTLTLFSGHSIFEAKPDGYKAHFLDLEASKAIDQAKRHAKIFEDATCGFLTDGVPNLWKLVTPSWLTVDGGMDAAEGLIRRLAWLPTSHDPFEIGATKTRSQAKFECFNPDEHWGVAITMDRSALPDADLFVEISSGYALGSHFGTFDKKVEHLSIVSRSIIDKLGLIVE